MRYGLEKPFVVLEGLSMSGKSTAIRGMEPCLVGWTMVREPGGTKFGEEVREIVQYKYFGVEIDPLATFFAYSASRAQLVAEVIIPELEKGEKVLSDRWWYSSYAYQGGGEGVDRPFIRAVSVKAVKGLKPLTLFFDLMPDEILERRKAMALFNLDRFDLRELDFFAKARAAYQELGETVDHWRVIDASQSPELVVADCLEVLEEYGLLDMNR